ncbi:hypothetical protein HS088_TW03G00635 [Tripterygium wilfordii]|uniref:Uncharacterized protein n=1 Tax=Tripterygium wilfordii TaxID=458696 RepID=A0A7J7DVG9_TRIWF|nr:CLAVATA3/ESR (CLE)-related protein 22 [Tripterygium wilfordii]KAF5750301.1 hypothetical protein HS088_TW03G00635 [Tripterygium wilfordii]
MKSLRRSRRGGGGVCLSVLLLLLLLLMMMLMMLMQLENTSCYGFGHQEKKINRLFKGNPGTGSSNSDHYKEARVHPVKSKGGGGGGDDDIFGVEKRKIHTGPNPLHNR